MKSPFFSPFSSCPVCFESSNPIFIQDYRNEDGAWSLYECDKCHTQVWTPFKNPGHEWYEQKSGYLVRDSSKPKLERGYHKKALDYLKKASLSNPSIKILDIGCGTGEFLNELKKNGIEGWGIDFDENAIKNAKKYFGLFNVFSTSLESFLLKSDIPKFDVITFFEVIEHLDNHQEFFKKIPLLLNENGIVILSTPSRERIFVNLIKADFPFHHLTRWNEFSIAYLFKKINFHIFKISYVEKFKFILDALSESLRFGFVQKTMELTQEKKETHYRLEAESNFLVKLVHLLGRLKDFLIFGIPAFIVFLFCLLLKRKNGDMIIWLKR